jgi:hypothetical protein
MDKMYFILKALSNPLNVLQGQYDLMPANQFELWRKRQNVGTARRCISFHSF